MTRRRAAGRAWPRSMVAACGHDRRDRQVPRFQLAAMTFAIGGLVAFASWIGRRVRGAEAAAGGLGRRRRRTVRLSCAVFPGAALCAAG